MNHVLKIALGAGIALLLVQTPAQAFLDGLLKKDAPAAQTPLQVQQDIPDEATFLEKTKIFSEQPFNDPALEFEIRLPTDWESSKISVIEDNEPGDSSQSSENRVNERLLGDIGKFRGPVMGNYRPTLTIQVRQIKYAIEAKYWLKNYLLESGYTPLDEIESADAKQASGSYVTVTDSLTFHNYIMVQITADTIYLVRFEVPLNRQEQISTLQKLAVKSFRLTNPKIGEIEEPKSFSLSDALNLSYPASWTVTNTSLQDPSHLFVEIRNLGTDSTIDGLIYIQAAAKSPQVDVWSELQLFKDMLGKTLGVEVKDLVSSTRPKLDPRFTFVQTEIYNVGFRKRDINDQEMRFIVLSDDIWYLFAMLLTPKEETDLYTWAHNTRSFDLMTESFR